MQFSFFGALGSILASSGFASFAEDPRSLIMILISFVLLYMGIGKKFEPLLLVPIAFGMLLANLPLTGLLNAPVDGSSPGMLWVFYQGVQHAIYPSIIFLGIGAMTDFGPLIARCCWVQRHSSASSLHFCSRLCSASRARLRQPSPSSAVRTARPPFWSHPVWQRIICPPSLLRRTRIWRSYRLSSRRSCVC